MNAALFHEYGGPEVVRIEVLESGQDAQGRRLAASARSQQCDDLSALDFEGRLANRHGVAEGLGDPVDMQRW